MKLLNKSAHALAITTLLAFGACTKSAGPNSPEETLKQYVDTAFSAKSQDARTALLKMSDGDAKVWLESMTEEVFKKHFIDNNMQLVSMKTSDKREDKDGAVSLVYELVFKDGKGPAPLTPGTEPSAATYTNKKIAYLKKGEGGAWKVTATKNVKTFIERKDALEVPPLSVLPPDENEEQTAPKAK